MNVEVVFFWNVFNPLGNIVRFSLFLDSLGVIFSATVLLISASVFVFSSFYMSDELFLKRFIIIVILFVISMNFLIFIPHIIALLLGWDGLGLVSFYLVIYYQNAKSLAGGILTALTNRIGDVLILLSIAFRVDQGHWLIINMFDNTYTGILRFLILFAAITKSAQVPFSRWLPAAMAAPTPVSALVHSSTLVTAGVFLLIRFYNAFIVVESFFYCLLLISSLTMLIAGIAAVLERDIKKVIALSTLRQLGVIIFSLARGLPILAFFHLLTHALFKALLFMAAGSLIHLIFHVQDLRSLGNLGFQVPVVSAAILASNLALIGFPFMAGFYSKDVILEQMMESGVSGILVFIGLGATLLTAVYSIRFMVLILWRPHKRTRLHRTSDNLLYLLIPLSIISVGAIVGGALLNWVLLLDLSHPVLSYGFKLMPLIIVLWGRWWTWSLSLLVSLGASIFFKRKLLLNSITGMWFLTPISTQPFIYLGKEFREFSCEVLDQGWVEMVGPQGVIRLTKSWFTVFQPWSRNSITIIVSLRFLLLSPLLLW